jgi:hypothetical protein
MKKLDPKVKKHPGWKHMYKPDRNEVRSEYITCRFTPPEKAALEFIATARGESLTEFLRSSVMTAARKFIDMEKASLGASGPVAPPSIRGAADKYVHRKAAPVSPLQPDRNDPVLLDIYRSLQAVGATVREIYLALKAAPGYDPSDPDNAEKFDCMADTFQFVQATLEEYLGLESGGETRIIPPTGKGNHRTETAAFRAAMEPDDDSLEDY